MKATTGELSTGEVLTMDERRIELGCGSVVPEFVVVRGEVRRAATERDWDTARELSGLGREFKGARCCGRCISDAPWSGPATRDEEAARTWTNSMSTSQRFATAGCKGRSEKTKTRSQFVDRFNPV
ncbi:hypothetical protein YC2023_032039 [Brassica napus]